MANWFALLAASVAFWAAIAIIFPAASRARFKAEVTKIRDDCDDAVIRGDLPDNEDTRYFLQKTDLMVSESARLGGISFMLAVLITFSRDQDFPKRLSQPAKCQIGPEAKALMDMFDVRLTSALALHLAGSSVLWWLFRPLQILLPARGHTNAGHVTLPQPVDLARRYNRALDEHRDLQYV